MSWMLWVAETALGELQGCIHIMWISIVFVVICTANIHVYCKDQIYIIYICQPSTNESPIFCWPAFWIIESEATQPFSVGKPSQGDWPARFEGCNSDYRRSWGIPGETKYLGGERNAGKNLRNNKWIWMITWYPFLKLRSSHENGWLEDEHSFWDGPFFKCYVSFREGNVCTMLTKAQSDFQGAWPSKITETSGCTTSVQDSEMMRNQ